MHLTYVGLGPPYRSIRTQSVSSHAPWEAGQYLSQIVQMGNGDPKARSQPPILTTGHPSSPQNRDTVWTSITNTVKWGHLEIVLIFLFTPRPSRLGNRNIFVSFFGFFFFFGLRCNKKGLGLVPKIWLVGHNRQMAFQREMGQEIGSPVSMAPMVTSSWSLLELVVIEAAPYQWLRIKLSSSMTAPRQ